MERFVLRLGLRYNVRRGTARCARSERNRSDESAIRIFLESLSDFPFKLG
jgi:hypothetical protein